MSAEVPNIDNCCDKEPYAFFGLAAYWAQVLEHSALNLAIVLKLPNTSLVNQTLFDALYASLTKKTFGELLKASKGMLSLSSEDEAYLYEAVELRNILIHRYFREHAEDFVSAVGRREMMSDLQLITSKFKRADAILEKLYAPLWEMHGVTEEFVTGELEDLRRKAMARDAIAEPELQADVDVNRTGL